MTKSWPEEQLFDNLNGNWRAFRIHLDQDYYRATWRKRSRRVDPASERDKNPPKKKSYKSRFSDTLF